MTYGIQSTGYVRKPLSVILAELEAAMVTEFGPGVVQTPQSPLGQLNGLMADLLAELDEHNLDLYQSYDPDQAEGTRLDTLGSIRLISRQAGESDLSYRQAITNQGVARIDLQDIARAVAAIEGVTYYHIWVNDTTAIDENSMPPATVAVAVSGGDNDAIAAAIRQYLVPGISLYGNVTIESAIDGFCRSFRIIRPIEVPVDLTVNVRKVRDAAGCPAPSNQAIEDYLLNNISLLNGEDVTAYQIRAVIEKGFSNVEVVSINGKRPDEDVVGPSVIIGFVERAVFNAEEVTVVSV